MRKIGFTPKIVAYASSMVLSIGIFGSYNMLLSVTPSSVPEIPVINLDTISPVISSTDYAESANPFGTISVTGAGAGVARMGMGGIQGVSTPTPPGVPPMPFTPRSEGFISIHAPRRGSDRWHLKTFHHSKNFNPRSPQGERLMSFE